ncbi:MAG: hypothetical protein ABIR66_10755 [Saprospiraceae bacterium]
MKTILIIILFGLTYRNLFSQNYLFESNASGFHLAGQLGSSKGSTLLGIGTGYTLNGKLTLGLVVGSENISDLNLNSTAIRPYMDFLAIKQGENESPVSLNIGIHYQHNSFPKIQGLNFKTYGFSMNVLHEFELDQNNSLIPSIGIGWVKTTVSLSGYSGNINSVGFGISTTAKLNNFYLEPSISFQKGGSQFSLSIGIIFPN